MKLATVKLTANFERNLTGIETFLVEAEAPASAFDSLLDELADTVVPNLERFPEMGRPFLTRPRLSVESTRSAEGLERQLRALGPQAEIREYVLKRYLLLYAKIDATVYLLSIRHHRQLSFDFEAMWPT